MIFKDVKSHDVMVLLHYESWGVKGQMRGINCQRAVIVKKRILSLRKRHSRAAGLNKVIFHSSTSESRIAGSAAK